MADLSNNYGLSEGVDCRNGKAVFNKLSCQSLRIWPPPPGYWEQSVNIPVRGTGPEAEKQREDIARGMMFHDSKFVSCRHPDCWICMGQKTHPTAEQIAAFQAQPSRSLDQRSPWGILSGERESLYGKSPKKRSVIRRIAARVFAFYILLRGRDQ